MIVSSNVRHVVEMLLSKRDISVQETKDSRSETSSPSELGDIPFGLYTFSRRVGTYLVETRTIPVDGYVSPRLGGRTRLREG
jgi:hypothetical protein